MHQKSGITRVVEPHGGFRLPDYEVYGKAYCDQGPETAVWSVPGR